MTVGGVLQYHLLLHGYVCIMYVIFMYAYKNVDIYAHSHIYSCFC